MYCVINDGEDYIDLCSVCVGGGGGQEGGEGSVCSIHYDDDITT